MFGYVTASIQELSAEEKNRYNAVYCGICRGIHSRAGQLSRAVLSYDMAFLALLLMSLYEPEEVTGRSLCLAHPLRRKDWTDNPYIRYAADMNIALAYYKALDDRSDDKKLSAVMAASVLEKSLPSIRERYPRQCEAMERCIKELSQLEKENCPDPDLCASCFGELMAAITVYREDLWAEALGQLGHALGRFIYLSDAAVDYRRDKKKGSFNPFLAMGMEENFAQWDQYLLLTMGRCTEYFEKLPLVQDKSLLDNILYSGVWTEFRRAQSRAEAGKEGM